MDAGVTHVHAVRADVSRLVAATAVTGAVADLREDDARVAPEVGIHGVIWGALSRTKVEGKAIWVNLFFCFCTLVD